jgi:Family of unknown function (DUF6502)
MAERSQVVLNCVLRAVAPLVRLLLRNGVTYTAFAAALKPVFLQAAQAELNERGAKSTDSAITLLSGVHRRDVRNLLRAAPAADAAQRRPLGVASQVVARWLGERSYRARGGAPRKLPRGSEKGGFDALVASVSSDVRPRAVLEELKRLGAATEDESGIELKASGFAPREGFEEMSWLFADNLSDHAAAAALNLQDDRNFLEQSVFVDSITPESAQRLHKEAVKAWKQAMRSVLAQAQTRFDHDAAHAEPAQRQHRARFGVYFFSDKDEAAS